MTNEYWENRIKELTNEYQGRYLAEPQLFEEAMAEFDESRVTLVRVLMNARSQGYTPCAMYSVDKVMEIIAHDYAVQVAKAQVDEEKADRESMAGTGKFHGHGIRRQAE